MKKVIMLNRISLDGYFAGPNGEIDWFIHDPAVDEAAHEMMQADTLLLGRVTYQMFESYWPHVLSDPTAPAEARKTADELNRMSKVVFSKTLDEVTWVNTKFVRDAIPEEVRQLKQGAGADIAIFGSGSIVQQLAVDGLIDEYLIIVTPVVLGAGRPLFKDINR